MASRKKLIALATMAALAAGAAATLAPRWIENQRLRHDVLARNAAYDATHRTGVAGAQPLKTDLDEIDVSVACTEDPRTQLVDKQRCADATQAKARFDNLVRQTSGR